MALNRYITWGLISVVAISLLALTFEFFQWYSTVRYNAAIAESRFKDAETLRGDAGVFAVAFAHHMAQEFQDARQAYVRLEHTHDVALKKEALFNLANTYLEEGLALDVKKEPDRVLPLIELAKNSYRELLQIDSQYWDAKYNLERALQLAPENSVRQNDDIKGLRGTIRTFNTTSDEAELP